MKLWLVRHAAPQAEPGLCYGRSDIAADAAATQRVARDLAAALPQGLAVRSSPLSRCERLASALVGLRSDLSLRPDPRLAEMDFGTWEGRRWDRLGEAALTAWTQDFAHHRPGGGECVQDFMARVNQAYRETVAGGQDTAWITHAGVIRAVHLLAQGIEYVERADQWPVETPAFGSWANIDC